MIDTINALELGKWATIVVVAYLLWRLIFKKAYELWLKNNFNKRQDENIQTLKTQSDIVMKKLEFEMIKLNRLSPIIEEINNAITNYSMLHGNYLLYIDNKYPLPANFEEKRLKQDKIIIKQIAKISLYVPEEYSLLLWRIRKIMSCSWLDPIEVNQTLRTCGNLQAFTNEARIMKQNLIHCFYDMSRKILGLSNDLSGFPEILSKHHLNNTIEPIDINPMSNLAWKQILLPEYYDDDDKLQAQLECEAIYKK
jgi:hypothetical protein